MENIIEIKDLTYSYKDKLIFDKLNFEIKRGTYTTIIGSNNSGKSTLVKILLGIIKTEADIKINNKDINKIEKNIIGYIPDNINDSIIMDTIIDEITLNDKVDNKLLNKLLDEFNLKDRKYDKPKNLSNGEQQLIYIISSLVRKPKIIICDEAFTNLDNLVKDKILKTLKKLSFEKGITIINVTNDTEDILYGDNVVIISDKKIIINDKKESILNDEKLFKKLHLKMPFMAELSIKLGYYGLLNNIETDMNRMINRLWKSKM